MRPRAVIALALSAALAAACTSEPGDAGTSVSGPTATGPSGLTATGSSGPTASGPSGPNGPLTLRVMEFNVEYGGTEVDFDSVPEVIEASGADIVAIEEGYANMPNIAASVGWEHYDERTQVLSRYPLLEPGGGAPFVYVELAPGRVVAVANVHLPSTSYGPSILSRRGASADELAAIEEHKRLSVLQPVLGALEGLIADEVPVFLIGDFNAPSHLDWTAEAVGTREHVAFAMPWPVSLAVEAAGLVDSYREANPDPVADPGLTWPADRPIVPGYNPFRNGAPADRIDFVYAGGPAEVTESLLVGEEGGPGVDVAVTPWPTDHRATVSTFEVEPSAAPTLVSVDRRLVTEGDDVALRFAVSGEEAGSIAVVPAGGDAAVDAVQEESLGGGTPGEEVAVGTAGWDPGAYEAVLVSVAGEELARAPFWVQAVGGEPQLATSRVTYDAGEAIEVVWSFTPGNRADWVGIYRRDADPSRASYLLWAYTGGTIGGSAVIDRDSPGTWPLEAGEYTAYLLQDDSYVAIAAADFTVR